ncbi:DNA topoisomerase [Candidatus Lokiarchaeum ossiferum]|uniref:DNA topoisomerase n=1 Tax=Candidatus Lokiarchaeum ossiferum TaxID=2951803 RepID=UPI00352DD371
MATLIISEKNKAAQAIAEALGPVNKISVSKMVKVYHVTSKNIYVVPLRGHIQQYENTGPYKKWTGNDPREIITNPSAIEKIPSQYAGPYISALKKYAKICDLCIIGTDADVEGCNIGMMDAFPFVKSANPKIQVKQLWLNDLQKTGIQSAYANLIPPKWSWANSGEARAILDAIIGFSATREVSLTLKPILNAINVKFTSIGRVQTSLLYLLYQREHLIRNFVSSPFWTLSTKIKIDDREIIANHLKNNFTDKMIAEGIYNKIKDEKEALIKDIKNTSRVIQPPTPLNTSKALLLITKTLKINAKAALKTMEDLYLNKIISYPRTDSDVYSKSYDHKEILQKFLTHNHYGQFVQDRFKQMKISPKQGRVNAGDHSPITPLIALEPSSSKFENDLQKKVYNLIARHYLATFGDPAEESDTKILLLIKEEPFLARISVLLKPGFYDIAPFLAKKYDAPLDFIPKLMKLSSSTPKLPISKINFTEKQTQPPPRYTDTSLLKLMELKHLGTKSTRPAIIQILLDRNYIERKKRAVFVTELGFLLIDALVEIWKPFLEPQFTAEVEDLLEEIRNQTKGKDAVVQEIKQKFLLLFDKFRKNKPAFIVKMNSLQKTGNILRGRDNKIVKGKQSGGKISGSGVNSSQTPVILTTSNCPKCKSHPMKFVISRDKSKKFFVCSDDNCKTFLSLPKKGFPKLLKSTCSICNFNIVKITSTYNKKKFDYYICPLCWTYGLKTQSGQGFCSKCTKYKIERGRCIKK